MLPHRTSVLRTDSGRSEFIVTPQQTQLSKLARVRVGYAIDKVSPVLQQIAPSQNKYMFAKTSMNSSLSHSRPMVQIGTVHSRLADEVASARTFTSRGSMRIPIVKTYPEGRYLLRIPRNDSEHREEGHLQDESLEQHSRPYQKRVVIPTVPPSMSMGGEYPADQYELIYESDDSSSPTSQAETNYDSGYSPSENKKRFFCSEMTCFWHGPTHASLRRHMMVTHNRGAVGGAGIRNLSAQTVRRSTKPKGVKCSECGQMAYSRPLLLRHMTQIHGIVAPLIYKTFSDRESLQNWLEQLRETHAVEFVVSSGSKKWGQGLQVHYLTCSRSGEQKERPNKKYRRPTRPSIKCGKNCMAYLKMKQNPTVSELRIEACLHHSGHEIDASKIRLEQNEWCRVIQLIREIDEGFLQIDVKHITRIREVLGNNGRFRLMTDEGLCQQLPKWIEEELLRCDLDAIFTRSHIELTFIRNGSICGNRVRLYMQQEELNRCAPGMEQEEEVDPLLCGYETSLSLFPEDLIDYKMEPVPYDDLMCDLDSTKKVAVNG